MKVSRERAEQLVLQYIEKDTNENFKLELVDVGISRNSPKFWAAILKSELDSQTNHILIVSLINLHFLLFTIFMYHKEEHSRIGCSSCKQSGRQTFSVS